MDPEEQNAQAVRKQLDRILSSGGFVHSERLSQFLRFVVEQHLEGKGSELKEMSVAIEVFDRKDYDPKQDSIVRTEAGRLRARLIEYYAGEGRADPVVIELPKGGYTPVFRRTDAAHQEPKHSSRWLWPGFALAVLAVAAVISWWWIQNKRAPIDIAVLPLDNLSNDPVNDYFADGLTDEIIRNLSVIEGLAVRSRTSSFAFKGKPRDVREAGKQLEVDYILEGSVLLDGRQLRINTQLVRVRDDFLLWSGRFDRELTDVFAIQDEISLGIVNNLRLKLGHGRRRYETSVEAYDLYLRARALQVQRGIRGVIQSIEPLEQAIAKDPSFAPAFAGLGLAYAIRSIQFPVDHPPDELIKMRATSEKAIQLDPLLAEAHEALALAYARDGQWEQAENSFRYAIDLDRNSSSTHADFAMWFLWVLGRNKEALEHLAIAEKTDPLSPQVQTVLALVLISAGRFDEAVEHCGKMSADDPGKDQCLARVRLGQGRTGEAIELLADDHTPPSPGFLGYAYARSGRRDEAEKMVAASHYATEQALIFAGLGDKDRALEALDRMAVLGPQRIGMYLNYPELSLLRDDLRLKAFRKRVGLPD
jgi:TolB-like protein